jgi:hypothetical protein
MRQLRDLQWRFACRQKLAAFASHALAVKNEFPALHHQHICTELQAVARGETRRLMVLMPPGAGKTTYASRLFPPWYFASHPHANIIGASHTSELAETNSTGGHQCVTSLRGSLRLLTLLDMLGRFSEANMDKR